MIKKRRRKLKKQSIKWSCSATVSTRGMWHRMIMDILMNDNECSRSLHTLRILRSWYHIPYVHRKRKHPEKKTLNTMSCYSSSIFFYYCLILFRFNLFVQVCLIRRGKKKCQSNISFKIWKKKLVEKKNETNVIAIRLYKYLHIEKAFCRSKNYRLILGNVHSSLPVSFIIELID